jgi:hypothetical protein
MPATQKENSTLPKEIPFDFASWLSRWDTSMSHIERLGMLRSLKYIRYNIEGWQAVLFKIILPLADGAHHLSGFRDEKNIDLQYLRIEAYFLLGEFFFAKDKWPYVYQTINHKMLDKMIWYFRRRETGDSNLTFTSFTQDRPPDLGRESSQNFEQEQIAVQSRSVRCREALFVFIVNFICVAWNYKKAVVYTSYDGSSLSTKTHEEISQGRILEIFDLIMTIDPHTLERLPWNEELFDSVISYSALTLCLFDRVSLEEYIADSHTSEGSALNPKRKLTASSLLAVALRHGWGHKPGLLKAKRATKARA